MNVAALLMVCLIGQADFRERVVELSRPQPDWVMLRHTAIASPDARHVAYQARSGDNMKHLGVILDQKWHKTGLRVFGPAFDVDSQIVTAAYMDGYWFVQVGKDKFRHKKLDFQSAPKVGPNATHVAILARHRHQRYVVDRDLVHPRFEAVDFDRLAFSADGTVLAYPARSPAGWHMVVNGQPSESWQGLRTGPIFADDGDRLVYVASASDGWHVVDQGKAGPAYRRIDRPTLSKDGSKLAYWTLNERGRWTLRVNHQPQPAYESQSPSPIVFSDTRDTLATMVKQAGQWRVIVNGQPHPPYSALGVGSLTVSPDGYHVAYAAMDQGRWWLIHDNQTLGPFTQLLANSFHFSDDSQQFIFAAMQHGQWFLHHNDQALGPFTDLTPDIQQLTFSPDGQHLAWIAHDHDAKVRLVIDGKPASHAFDRLIPGSKPVWTSNSTILLIAANNRQGDIPTTFSRLSVNLTPGTTPGTTSVKALDLRLRPGTTPGIGPGIGPHLADVPTPLP